MAATLSNWIAEGATLEKIATGFSNADGPVFSRRGYLLFCETGAKGSIVKLEGGKSSVVRKAAGAAGLTFDHQGRTLSCEQPARVVRTEKDASLIPLAEAKHGVRQPRDLVYAIDGSIYFTDPPAGLVYVITRDGFVRPAAAGLAGPSALALSANQQTLFVTESVGRVKAFPILSTASLDSPRIHCELAGVSGIKTDEEGNLWAAASKGITVIAPDGKAVGTLETPEPVSNAAWGDGFNVLYLTARRSIFRIRTKAHGTRTF